MKADAKPKLRNSIPQSSEPHGRKPRARSSRGLLSAVLLLFVASCNSHKIVPDKELANIFHDIYLVNAYVGQANVNIDSLNIYEPVFASYGYTSEDIQYTIGNFAKRKSARLSDDVVEVANQMLRSESNFYRRRIAIRDTIALMAKKRFSERVYFDSLITIRRVADTARLRIVIDSIREGSYEVSYGYILDSLDRNLSIRTNLWFEDSLGRQSGGSQRRLEREKHTSVQISLSADGHHRRLVLGLNGYRKDMTVPHLTIDSLTVTYNLPESVAVRRLARSWYGGPAPLDSLPTSLPERHETYLVAPLVDTAGIGAR